MAEPVLLRGLVYATQRVYGGAEGSWPWRVSRVRWLSMVKLGCVSSGLRPCSDSLAAGRPGGRLSPLSRLRLFQRHTIPSKEPAAAFSQAAASAERHERHAIGMGTNTPAGHRGQSAACVRPTTLDGRGL